MIFAVLTRKAAAALEAAATTLWINASVGFKGQLMVVCVPRGSTWSLTLSDVPNLKTPAPTGLNDWVELERKRIGDMRDRLVMVS